jgi:predicted lipoprotein with Yx(FWY)xxD motif
MRVPARLLIALLVLGLTVALPVGAIPAAEGRRAPRLRVKVVHNEELDARILVTARGRTLYRLDGERRGRFLCTSDSCLATWPPLILKRGARPVGVARLGSVERPDGRRQVTYKGRPLYRFAFDTAKGEVGGEGFVDVGTWRAARAPRR